MINDVTYRIMLTCSMVKKLKCKIIDFETAFLHGDLEEDIYMNCPEGMDHTKDECLQLNKTIYGLVQSARQWYKKADECLKHIGFKRSEVDPCLYTMNSDDGVVYLGIYVDDCLCCGSEEAINKVIKKIKNY